MRRKKGGKTGFDNPYGDPLINLVYTVYYPMLRKTLKVACVAGVKRGRGRERGEFRALKFPLLTPTTQATLKVMTADE